MLSENGNGMIMPVAPTGNSGFGGFGQDGLWILLLLLICGGGWGNGFGYGGGIGGLAADGAMLYPWMNQSQQVSDGFRDQMINSSISGIQSSITSGFGDVQNSLCSGFAGVNASVNGAQSAISQQLYSNEIANLNRSFAEQTANSNGFNNLTSQLAQCCCDNRLATVQTQNIVQNEGNATRFADANNTRDIIDATNRGNQMILDKLCQLELDGVKQNYENRIAGMQNVIDGLSAQVNAADRRVAMSEEVDALYNRLNNCPVPTTPVYGRTPIFTCNSNPGYGCGCGGFAA